MSEHISVTKKTGAVLAFIMTLLLCLYSIIMGRFSYTEAWAGYMFFWFWSSIRNFDKNVLKYDIPNSITGIVLSCLMYYTLQQYGIKIFEPVIVVTLIIILFFSVTKIIPYIIGETTFLFFTILTAHIFLQKSDYFQIIICYFTGVLFFSVTIGTMMAVVKTKSSKPDIINPESNRS